MRQILYATRNGIGSSMYAAAIAYVTLGSIKVGRKTRDKNSWTCRRRRRVGGVLHMYIGVVHIAQDVETEDTHLGTVIH